MNSLRTKWLLIALLANLLITFSQGYADVEVVYLGEYCFSLDSEEEDAARKTLHLGVLSYGDIHYPAHGKMTVEGRAGVIPVHGAVVKDGDDIVITLSGSDHGLGSDSLRIHAIIGENQGKYSTIEHMTIPDPDNPTGEVTVFYKYGSFSLIQCPVGTRTK